MAYRGNQFVWLVAACAALFGQLVPQALCRDCDRPCCTAAVGHENGGRPADAEPTGQCPLCAAAEACPSPVGSAKPPCHCQLDARQSQPLTVSRAAAPADDAVAWPAGFAVPSIPPRSSGVSADYLSASLAVPIRPPRILFGVWRN